MPATGCGWWAGWVRDRLLDRPDDGDLDFATDARPPETLRLLKRWGGSAPWTSGMEFGTIGVEKAGIRVEVTTFRSEVYEPGSRNPRVEFGDSLQTDLSRRDFTVNTMAIALPDVELVDLFGGISDLVARRLKTPLAPSISFSDDPLRMLRAFRFASTLGFDIDAEVLEAVRQMHDRLAIVSRERIRDEFCKLMLGPAVSRALEMATDAGLAGEFLPELPGLKLEQDPIHRHKDVFHHTLAVLDNAISGEKDGPDLVLRLAALLHDIGKPRTREITPRGVTFYHHEVVGAQMTEARDARAAVSDPDDRGGQDPGLPPPAVPHLPAGLDRPGGAPLRPRCRTPAGDPERPGALRLHYTQPPKGRPARQADGRPGGVDFRSQLPGGAKATAAGTGRERGNEAPEPQAGPDRRRGAGLLDGGAAGRGRDQQAGGLLPAGRLVRREAKSVSGPKPPEAGWYNAVADHLGSAYLGFEFTQGTEQEVDFLYNALSLKPGARLLDVGTGPGRHAVEFAKRGVQVVGIDISSRFLAIARERASEAGDSGFLL